MEVRVLLGAFVLEDVQRDEDYIREALVEAEKALEHGDVPVGALVVVEGRVVGRGHNERERRQDPTAHAEMIALVEAARTIGSWRLQAATVYVTLEPCVMCAGAMVLARVKRLVFGAADPKAGACVSLYRIVRDERLNHRLELRAGVLAMECGAVLQRFFRARRGAGVADRAGLENQ